VLKRVRSNRFLARKLLDQLLDELIGEPVEVSRSRDKTRIGLSGIILLERKDRFLIDTGKKRVRVYKRGTEFVFPTLGLRVMGDVLYVDPARRTMILDLRRR